jgi:hypothetical protein
MKPALTGKSRSKGTSSWEAYIVSGDWQNTTYEADKAGTLFDEKGTKLADVKAGDKIKILSIATKKIGSPGSMSANVEIDGKKGWTKLETIKKPTASKNTKMLTPASLGIAGKKLTLDQLVSSLIPTIEKSTIDPLMKDYLKDAIDSIVNKKLFEAAMERFTKEVKLSRGHALDPSTQLNVISKNFGEILAALFILKTSKKAKAIEYPSEENAPLCDFIVINSEKGGREDREFYSVKSGGGSSTDLENIKTFLPYLDVDENSKEYQLLKLIMATMKLGKTGKNVGKEVKDKGATVDGILRFWNTPEYSGASIDIIKKRLGLPSGPLTKAEIDKVWKDTIEDIKKAKLGKVSAKYTALKDVLADQFGYAISGQTAATFDQIFSSTAKKDISGGGFLLYPMGSALIKRLNTMPAVVDLLNNILKLASNSGKVLQSTVDAYNDKIVFKIISFKNNKFKFSYNAMMKAPGNRPLGFSEV